MRSDQGRRGRRCRVAGCIRTEDRKVDSIGRRNTLSESLEVWAMASKDWARKISDVPEGTRRQWRADRALRAPMRSPGRPQPSREVQRQFWRVIATGVTTVEASLTVGVSWPVGARWFRHAGGMTPLSLAEPTGRYLSFAEREELAILHARARGSVRSHARWDVIPARSAVSCAVTAPLVPGSRSTGPRWRSGRPRKLPGGPSRRSWPRTSDCTTTSRHA